MEATRLVAPAAAVNAIAALFNITLWVFGLIRGEWLVAMLAISGGAALLILALGATVDLVGVLRSRVERRRRPEV